MPAIREIVDAVPLAAWPVLATALVFVAVSDNRRELAGRGVGLVRSVPGVVKYGLLGVVGGYVAGVAAFGVVL